MLLKYVVKYNELVQSNSSMKSRACTILIPVRMGSSRLPNKPLKEIAGKPLLKWVIELAQNINFEASLIVLTEDKIIKDFVDSLGVECFLTDKFHKNGTARILEILDSIDSDFVINLQGDEPLVNPLDLSNLYEMIKSGDSDIASICHEVDNLEAEDPSNVKVVFDINQYALYFSRSKIPYGAKAFYSHKGIYAFKRDALEKIKFIKSSFLANFEDLEQLQWLENNMSIRMLITKNKTIGVDTQDDFIKAENALLSNDIKALICDIDGTLTNGLVWYGDNGEQLKSFNVKDGLAIKKLLSKGFKVGFISGRDSTPLRFRAKELGVEFVKFGQADKKRGCLELLSEMKLEVKNVAYIGDDESDISCCSLIPFSFAVKDCHKDLKIVSRFHLEVKGGEGVVSEFIEKLNFLSINPKI